MTEEGKPAPDDPAWRRATEREIYRWYRTLKAPMPYRSFRRLPRHPSYKLEYLDGQCWISPRWNTVGAYLTLRPPGAEPPTPDPRRATIRPLEDADWDRLPEVMADAFVQAPPLGMLGPRRRRFAAGAWLKAARDGYDGPPVLPACMVALEPKEPSRLIGGLIVTILMGRARGWFVGRRSREPAPPEGLAAGADVPHLSWIFVEHGMADRGVGTALLAASTRVLWDLGHRELASTILRGNDASLAWHWRAGFRLLPSSFVESR